MRSTIKILLGISAFTPLAIQAQIIMCKDAAGKTYTSDRPIMECAGRPIREFGSSGYLKREVPAPLTAEQKRQKQLEEEKRKADEVALAEQRLADRAMLARYQNEGDIEVARKRTLEIADEQRKRHSAALASAEKQLTQLQLEIARIKNPKDVPPGLQHKADETGKAIYAGKKRLQDAEAEVVRVNLKYDAALNRYRELRGQQATASK